MQETEKREKGKDVLQIAIIVGLCAFVLLSDLIEIRYLKDSLKNAMLSKILQQSCGVVAVIMIMARLHIRLFSKPQQWLYLIPCFVVAIDNFQFFSYFNGNMQLVTQEPINFILFALYCLAVGLFEECIFRGIIFSVLASQFSKDKKGFLLTFFVSSFLFGAAHLFNGFSLSTLWQVGYTTLTGGLFAFCLIKTKNVICCGVVHGLYNFCGLLFEKFNPQTGSIGLGLGVVFDMGTVIMMLVVSIVVGAFVLYKTFTYPEEERTQLYEKLGANPLKTE